jgi:hypothetical protein
MKICEGRVELIKFIALPPINHDILVKVYSHIDIHPRGRTSQREIAILHLGIVHGRDEVCRGSRINTVS